VVKISGLRFGDFPIIDLVTFDLAFMTFGDGSIFDRIRIRKGALALTAAFLSSGFMATFGGEYAFHRMHDVESTMSINQRIEERLGTATKGQPATEFCGARLSLDALRNSTERTFYYTEKGISPMERACRVAAVQAVDKLALHTGLIIDGQEGPKTREHEKKIGELTHTSGLNGDGIYRGALAAKAHEILSPRPSSDGPTDPNP